MTDKMPDTMTDGSALDDVDPQERAETLEALTATLPQPLLPPALLARVQTSTSRRGRLHRFAATVARLLDVAEGTAKDLLDLAADPASYGAGMVPGMSLLHVQGGPTLAKAITGFVRLEGGIRFPEHTHLGQESVLVLQGCYLDGERRVGPGEIVIQSAESSHAIEALPGPDLVYLAVVQDGLRMGKLLLLPGDPRA